MEELIKSINRLRKERNAVILAHVYQRAKVQDIADYVGDSLELSRKAVSTDADVIVFCGVLFMSETAAILNPQKTVLLPDKFAGCGLADMATGDQIRSFKEENPDVKVVSYVNSSADVKSDNPHKKFHSVNTLCEGMGKITLDKVKMSLETLENKVHVSEEIRQKAKNALDGMLGVT